jgi:hypothetical protein
VAGRVRPGCRQVGIHVDAAECRPLLREFAAALGRLVAAGAFGREVLVELGSGVVADLLRVTPSQLRRSLITSSRSWAACPYPFEMKISWETYSRSRKSTSSARR